MARIEMTGGRAARYRTMVLHPSGPLLRELLLRQAKLVRRCKFELNRLDQIRDIRRPCREQRGRSDTPPTGGVDRQDFDVVYGDTTPPQREFDLKPKLASIDDLHSDLPSLIGSSSQRYGCQRRL